MARRKKKKRAIHINKKWYLVITLIVVIGGLILLILNRTIKPELEHSIKFDNEEIDIYIGDTIRPKYTILNEKINDSLLWTTSNNKVASVDSTGKITAKSFGDVIITVELNNGSFDTITVKVKSYPVYLRVQTSSTVTKGWYNKELTVNLNTQNIEELKYCVTTNEECIPYIDYKDKIVLKNGIWYLNVEGTDKNGKKVTHREIFKIDFIEPTCNIERIGKFADNNSTISLICKNDLSGIYKYEWYRDNEKIITTSNGSINASELYQAGTNKYAVKVIDNASNYKTYVIE